MTQTYSINNKQSIMFFQIDEQVMRWNWNLRKQSVCSGDGIMGWEGVDSFRVRVKYALKSWNGSVFISYLHSLMICWKRLPKRSLSRSPRRDSIAVLGFSMAIKIRYLIWQQNMTNQKLNIALKNLLHAVIYIIIHYLEILPKNCPCFVRILIYDSNDGHYPSLNRQPSTLKNLAIGSKCQKRFTLISHTDPYGSLKGPRGAPL